MASTWGKVLDQASIMLSRQDLEKACIKATRHDNMIPKEKHVRRLVVYTHERPDLIDKIYAHLAERLEIPDWIVVIKTLEVYHRLFRDGNPRFLAELKWKGTIFPLSKFNDPTSAEAHTQSVFIRKYALYLEEKVLVYRALRMEFEKDPSLLKGLTVEESFVRLPKLQRQLDALINCQTSAEAITNPITALAFEMLLKDSFKLYRGLNDGIITLLESYFSMDKSLAITALDIYKTFMRETSSIIAMYEMAKKKFTLELPDLKHAPTTLVNSLEDYLRDAADDSTGAGRNADYNRRRSNSPVPKKSPSVSNIYVCPVSHSQFLTQLAQSASPQPAQTYNTPSLIDPFGVNDLASPPAHQPVQVHQSLSPHKQQPQQQPVNLFDPFGDSSLPPQQPSQFTTQPTSFSNPTPAFSPDPFATPVYGNNFTPQPQTSTYDIKAQQIKAAYTQPIQPTSPILSPSNQPSTSYPKPNYNVALGAPQAVGGQSNAPQQYYNAPVVYSGAGVAVSAGGGGNLPVYYSPPMQPQAVPQQHPPNPFL